jgi:hypothetical protein
MEQNKTLKIALKKAVDNGFRIKPHQFLSRDKQTGEVYGYESIIFDHEFARALWGESDLLLDGNNVKVYASMPVWKHHIMLMAAADDRIAYLEANT